MPQYWEITTTLPIAHGADILNQPATVTFIINIATGERIDAQPTGTLFAWRTPNQISFRTNALLAPFVAPPVNWVLGQIDINVGAGAPITHVFTPANIHD